MTEKRVNTAHQGRRVEYKVIGHLGEYGWSLLQRSAASKGKVDLSFISSGYLAVVQVKRTSPQCTPEERRALIEVREQLGPMVLPLTVCWPFRAPAPTFRLLYGRGPKEWAPWSPEAFEADRLFAEVSSA